jgi:CDP-diacylglycerol--serine O-phosphatidyltransferase
MSIEGRYEFALAAIVFAALLDGIDGRIARLLKASSRFGAELDSLADFVNFGVAPRSSSSPGGSPVSRAQAGSAS